MEIMSHETKNVLELVSDFELDDVLDITVVMSKFELETILAIDAAHSARDDQTTEDKREDV